MIMSRKNHRLSPLDPVHWNPQVPEWPSYQAHRPRIGWDDRRMVTNLFKVLGGLVLALGLLLGIAVLIAGGWDTHSPFGGTVQRIQPTEPSVAQDDH